MTPSPDLIGHWDASHWGVEILFTCPWFTLEIHVSVIQQVIMNSVFFIIAMFWWSKVKFIHTFKTLGHKEQPVLSLSDLSCLCRDFSIFQAERLVSRVRHSQRFRQGLRCESYYSDFSHKTLFLLFFWEPNNLLVPFELFCKVFLPGH